MDEIPTLFERYSNFMNSKTRGVQVGCYSVAFIGLTIAMRRVRPFSRFKKPTDIPKRFIKMKKELTGVVERIEPNGALLMINHKPLVKIHFIKEGELPIKIANIHVSGHGISWLQTLAAGSEIKFIPLCKEKEFVECEIKMLQHTHDHKTRIIDLGESLISIGFGKLIEKPIRKTDSNYSYYMRLKSAEELALKKKMGIKYYIKPTMLVFQMIGRQLNNIFKATVKIITTPANKTSKLAIA